jgi:TonB-dependent receptor
MQRVVKSLNASLALSALSMAVSAILLTALPAEAQEGQSGQSPPQQQDSSEPIEEIIAIGRTLSSSQRVANERLNDASVVDTLGAESIARLGDSTVASALRRIPGLSLVSDKFVYIRGLGERYSATSLNGAQIPSPDLTRNVIPLDVFPTSVVDSLRVQKAWAPDMSANFGGGLVDIRTKGIPGAFDLNFEFGTGGNSLSSGVGYTYPGGSDDNLGTDDGTRALPQTIVDAVGAYQGGVDVQNILRFLRGSDPTATLADAQVINRSLGVALNRDIGVQKKSLPNDGSLKLSVGNRFDFSDDWQFGFLVGGAYDTSWRKTTRRSTNFAFPTERTDTEDQTTHSVNLTSTLNMGLNFTSDHEISTTSLFLRNTDDETAVRDFFNENREISDGLGFRNYRLQFEERNMRTNQIQGVHYIGADTRERFPKLTGWLGWLPEEANVRWYHSESKATTDIPNQVGISSTTVTDPLTAAVLSEAVALQTSAADYRFTDLADRVNNDGWDLTVPFKLANSTLEIKGGGAHSEKARTYKQTQFSLGPLGVSSPAVLAGGLDQVFSDTNILDTSNNFVFARQGTNNQSYLAATMTDALYADADWTYNDKFRISGGARWENYRQAAIDWNPYGYSEANPQVTTDPDVLAAGTFTSDEVYPAASFTYMSDFWAEQFQLRFGWSQTSVRPDLREITDASYIDPITQDTTRGNSGVVPADMTNLDIRAEWFFSSGDNFTVTLFNKDIQNPIEFFESAASDTTVAREIVNADSGYVKGVELEGLKRLGFIGDRFDAFFVQGNLTLQDSELVAGPRADAPTNPVRKMSGASDYVVNFMLGYDSPNTKHSASLIYNVFGERLYVAGRNGAPDGYEQPFDSLDFTYSWYPTDKLTFKAKAQNLLDQAITIERAGVVTFEEEPGTTFVLAIQWNL